MEDGPVWVFKCVVYIIMQ